MRGLSLVIPLYNEADNIRELIGTLSAALEKEKIEYELVLVDNGSSDATGALIEEYARADNRIRRVNVRKNIGYGWGIIKGLEAAEGEHLGFMCGDGQIKPADVVRVYRKLTEERLDLCKVRRVYREDGLQRK
ncbi:MAG: glycosyltransferase family 2 protein, partial [Candidatus Omnitrophota bacterium]